MPLRSALVCAALLATSIPLATADAAPAGPPVPVGVWVAGDTHVHDDHSSDGSLPRQGSDQQLPGNNSDADAIQAGELHGLDFMPLTDHRTYDQHWDPLYTSSSLVLVPGEEAEGSPHAIVLGGVDELVDGANPPGSAGFRHVQQNVWSVHAEDANWQTAHPDDGEVNGDGSPNTNASTVGIDTVEVWNKASDPDAEIDYAENRWNHGFRFAVTGACDSHFKELNAAGGPGSPTTWVYATSPTERGIIDGFRNAHTSVSSGPTGPQVMLDADLDGDGNYETMAGDEAKTAAGPRTLRVHVLRGSGFQVFVYASPGRTSSPVATFKPVAADETFMAPVSVPAGDSWFRVEVRGAGGPAGLGSSTDASDQLQALTTPLFFSTGALPAPGAEIPVPSDDAAPDAATALAREAGGFAGFGDVAQSSTGRHAVWETHAPGATHVMYRRDNGSAVDLAPSSDAARFPHVAAHGSEIWVVWQDERGGQLPHHPDVYARHSSDGGATWLPEQKLTAGTSRSEHPDVAVLPGGKPVVAWSGNATGAFDVYAQVLGVDSAPVDVGGHKDLVAGTPNDTRSAVYPPSLFPSLAVAPDGQVSVAFQDDRTDPDPLFTGHFATDDTAAADGTVPDDWEVLVASRPSGGAWAAPVNASNTAGLADRHPTIAYTPDGTLHALWDAKSVHNASGVNLAIRGADSTDGGHTWTDAAPVGLSSAAMSQRPDLGLDSDGTLRAVWTDSRSDDWRWRIATSTAGPTGWTAPVLVTGPGNAMWASYDGGALVFSSDRGARVQRDRTEGVYALALGAAAPPPDVPEVPFVAMLVVAAMVVLGAAAHRRRTA